MFKRNWIKRMQYKKIYLTWEDNLIDIFSEHSTYLPQVQRKCTHDEIDIHDGRIYLEESFLFFCFLFFFFFLLILHRNYINNLHKKDLLPKRG